MQMRCAELFADIDATIIGDENECVGGLAYRSDAVKPRDAFFCIVGQNVDGHSFAQDAIDRGASVIVAERRLYLADATDACVVIVSDTRRAMAHAACNFYGNPSQSFELVGITGTNGKTTTTYLVDSICRAAGMKTGIVGTVGVKIGDEAMPADHTTPESADLQRIFAQMRDQGVQEASIEVSSHALDLMRTLGSDFDVVAFTNLTQDHLDYHQTFQSYFEAKALLFGADYPAKRVIGIGTKWGVELAQRCRDAEDSVLTFGFDEGADIFPLKVEYHTDCTSVELSIQGSAHQITYPLAGRFNVENVMCAIGIGVQLGLPLDVILHALADACAVPGRLEQVGKDLEADISVYVDYAHTPDALEKAISSIREIAPGRVIVVFGCGGDRDRGKRPIMGRTSLCADISVITSDNPRSEDPKAIIDEIVEGILDADKDKAVVIPDRKEAIGYAIANARPGDVVLLAGKGHEDYQIIGSEKLHFDDREVARDALAARCREKAE